MLCSTWNLSSLNKNWTLAPCAGSEDSLPLNCQGSHRSLYFLTTYNLYFFSLSSFTFIKRLFSWKTQQWPQDWKRSVFIPIPKKGNARERSNYRTIALVSHTSKVMLKFSKLGFNSMWTKNFQMFKLDLEKTEKPEIKLPTPVESLKKQENFRKTSTSALLTMPKSFDCVDHNKLWKSLKEMGVPRTPDLPPKKSVCRSRSNS